MTQYDFEVIAGVFKRSLMAARCDQEERTYIEYMIIAMGRELVDTYENFDRNWFSLTAGLPEDHWIIGYKGGER